MALHFRRTFVYALKWFSTSVQSAVYESFQLQLHKAVVSSRTTADHDYTSFTRSLWSTLKHGVTQANNDELSVTPEIIADGFSQYYSSLNSLDQKRMLFDYLSRDMGPDHSMIYDTSKQLCNVHNENRDVSSLLRAEGSLRLSLRPAYLELFTLIPRMANGLQTLISMREDLLSVIEGATSSPSTMPVSTTHDNGQDPSLTYLRELDSHLQSVLGQWFTLGLLDLQRITWESPCDIIEKVSDYEAVHSVKHWRDIKHRVGPYRRVFVFTHRTMPREPLIILHTALTPSPSDSVQALLKLDSDEVEHPNNIGTAVFYSISAAHKGLSGIELGNLLILQVVKELKKEFPWLDDFVTLSPIPGFRKWVESHLKQNIAEMSESCKISEDELASFVSIVGSNKNESKLQTLQRILSDNSWVTDSNNDGNSVSMALKGPLLSLCARYLVQEKRRKLAYNPVTHFHIRNGASVWRLNWLADVSPRGINHSYGIMTNYRYSLSEMIDNNIKYLTTGNIQYSEQVAHYLKSGKTIGKQPL